MLNDFILIQHKFEDGITIYPIGDVHLGAIEHCGVAWNTFCDMIRKDKNKKIILVGDLMNVVEGLDCLIVGHTHKGTVSRPSKIVIDAQNNKVTMKHYTVVSSVSWLNYGGYALQKMLLPSDVAKPQQIILDGKAKKNLEVRW